MDMNGQRPGFEEDVGEELAGLTIPGLSEHIPALFKVDAAGIGQPIVGKALSPGQEYRMVVPPDHRIHEVMVGICNDLDFGWQLWDFVMPVEPDREVQNLLAELQLDVGKTAPRLCWIGFPPASYRQTPRGETYPCFHVKRPPILSIKGLSIPKSGKASVFVFSGDQFTSASLPEGMNGQSPLMNYQLVRPWYGSFMKSLKLHLLVYPFSWRIKQTRP